jgi:hypothetical protein
MRSGTAKKRMKSTRGRRKQVNVRVEPALYRALEAVAREERRSVPKAAQHLMEEGLRHHLGERMPTDDAPAHEIAALASAGGAFDWLANEPDLYDDSSGEPL